MAYYDPFMTVGEGVVAAGPTSFGADPDRGGGGNIALNDAKDLDFCPGSPEITARQCLGEFDLDSHQIDT